ncbi:glycosyltransferase [Desulfobacterota bacterium M19]
MPAIIPDISVCAVFNRRPQTAAPMLRSIEEDADPVAVEIFLANIGTENDDELLLEFPRLKLFSLPGCRENEAHKQIIELAAGRYILLMAADAVIHPGSLLPLVNFMDDNPDTGLASPRVLNAYGRPEAVARLFPRGLSSLGLCLGLPLSRRLPAPNPDHNTEVDWLWSGALIIRPQLIEDIGLPRRRLSPLSLMLYARRAQKEGWHIFYVHEAAVIHPNPLYYAR